MPPPPSRRPSKRTSLVLALTLVALLVEGAAPDALAARASRCGRSNGYRICLLVPDGTLSGDVTVRVAVKQSTAGIIQMLFSWGPSPAGGSLLMTDFEWPYRFVWPTAKYVDEDGSLSVQVVTDAATGVPVSIPVSLRNGNSSDYQHNPNDWRRLFRPEVRAGRDPVTAAVGGGGGGKVRNAVVVHEILRKKPGLFLYLGDVYEFATPAVLRTNYGLAAFDDPRHRGTSWGRMASYTAPTQGNHEGDAYTQFWVDYWHGRPFYTSFDFGGVHYIDLDSECGHVGGCGPTSPQYGFAKKDLAANTLPCVIAFWHKPVLSVGSEHDTADVGPLWEAAVSGGADLVLAAHSHDMEEYVPLNAQLEAGQPDSHAVELVSGAGGTRFPDLQYQDDRNAWSLDGVPGALFITAVGGRTGHAESLRWRFVGTHGDVRRHGRVTC